MYQKSKRFVVRTSLAIAAVMILPVVFYFHLSGRDLQAGPGGTAGELFGKPVPWETFQQQHQLIRSHLEQQFGAIPEGLEPILEAQTWNRLILQAEARRAVRISNEELAEAIRSQPAFHADGRFEASRYQAFVRQLGVSTTAFEDLVRDDLRIATLLQQVDDEVRLTEEDLQAAYRQARERLQAALVRVETAALLPEAQANMTDETARAYYEAHPEAVRVPRRRAIDYLGRASSEVDASLPPLTEEALRAYYEAHADQFLDDQGAEQPFETAQDMVRARLRATLVQDRLTELALDLEDDLSAGLRLEEIAASRGLTIHAAGPMAQPNAGIPNGPSVAMLAEAFRLPLGDLTQVQQTPVGVFVLRPVEELPERLPPFEDVRDAITSRATAEAARALARARAAAWREAFVQARQRGLTAEEALLTLKPDAARPAPFTRDGPVDELPGMTPDQLAGIFALSPGSASDVLETPDAAAVVVVLDRIPADETRLAEERDAFREQALAERQDTHRREWLDALRARAHLKSLLDSPVN